jgi:hypothetical protein
MLGPMVEETTMRAIVDVSLHSCHEKVASMVEQMTNPPPTVMLPCLGNLPLPFENIQTPILFRSKDEQLVGHELIKALRNLELSMIPHLSPSSHHESPSHNEALVVQSKGNQSYNRQRKLKIKSRKSGFKLVRDMLTMKLVVVNND